MVRNRAFISAAAAIAVVLPTFDAWAQDGGEALICAARMTTLAAAMEMGGDPALRDRLLGEAERAFERARKAMPAESEAALRRKLRALIWASARRYRDKANVSVDLQRCAAS